MQTAAIFSIIVAVTAAQRFPPDNLPRTCAATTCLTGQKCVLQDVQCVRAPCYPQPVCVEDQSKRGECPKPGPFEVGICASTCNADSDCKGADKCCKNACGATTCQSPQGLVPEPVKPSCDTVKCGEGETCELQKVTCIREPCHPVPVCVKNKPKAGLCPKPSLLEVGICASTCTADSDCKGADKCCRNACGATTCQSPQGLIAELTKPSCATVRCKSGHKCVMQQVFCFRAPCNPTPVCVPIQSKRGECPKPGPFEVGICASTCDTDSDCKGADKCCRNACGATTCQYPQGLVPVNPTCDTVKCGAGEKCVMKAVQCFRAPCPSARPVCIPFMKKEGVCPKATFSIFSFFCFSRCQSDGECPGAQKCCRTRCGARCLAPQPQLTCASYDCRPGFKCVMKKQCGRQGCTLTPGCEPELRCPFYPAWINPNCVRKDTCSTQGPNTCPSGTICCSTDCGRRCVAPMVEEA